VSLLDGLLFATAFLTAALSGVAGMGGGTLLMAALLAAGVPPQEAIPLFAAVQLVSNLSRTAAYLPAVEWRATGWFLLAAVPATLLLVPWVQGLEAAWIEVLLASLILLSLRPGQAGRAPLPPLLSFLTAGALNGSIGSVVGATGLVVGRLFLRPEWRRETVIGTLALTQVLGHGLRVLAFGAFGLSAWQRPLLLAALCAAVIAGTLAGRRLNRRLDEARYARLVHALLWGLSLYLLTTGLWDLWTSNSTPPPSSS
jgi:uncharacterized membrane protein YfcA